MKIEKSELNNQAYLEIYWDDLVEDTKKEIIELFGDNCNFDIFPIASIEIPYEESGELNV